MAAQPSKQRPIKVMHIIARLNIGGAAIYVIQLADELNRSNEARCEAQLVCGVVSKTEGDMQYIADGKQLPITIVPTLGREISLTGDLKTLWQLWRLIRRERPDIVHTHTAKAGFVGRVAAWLAGVPIIIHTFHGHVFSGYFGKRKTQLFLLLERLCIRISSAIVTLSPALKHELANVYRVAPQEKIEIIELGFDMADLAALQHGQGDFRQQHGIPLDVPLIAIVGRLVPIKNHDLFLKAAQCVLAQVPDAHFAIVGDGERRAELEAMTQALGIADRVHFTGWIKDLLPVYSAVNVLVLCSHNEGLPVSLIEAMAAGVPVVSTDVGGASDLLQGGEPGKIVPPDNADLLAGAIVTTLNNPATKEITVRARDVIVKRYSIQHSASRTVALYQRLLRQRGLQ